MTSSYNGKPKILVVDDEPDNLDLLYRTFYREFQVLRAESAPAALNLLSSQPDIAVIISDQRMPTMSGTEFLSLTATQYPDIIRIILTGYTDVEDLVEAINSGKVFKYVTKPWDDEELKTVVRQAVDTHNVLKARTQELRRALRQESLLNTVTTAIRRALNYRQILQTLVETVGAMFEVDGCLLRPFRDGMMDDELFVYSSTTNQAIALQLDTTYLGDVEGNGHRRITGDRTQENESPVELPWSIPNLLHTLWETKDVQVIHDVQSDPTAERLMPNGQSLREVYQTEDIRSSLVVPLVSQQELIAVLALHQCQHPRLWQEEEVQLVRMVASQAAPAVAQARTYEQVRALAKREALVNTITTTIRSSLDPQDIFAAITQELGQALHADGCALSLWSEGDEYVQCVGLHDATLDGVADGGTQEEETISAEMRSPWMSSTLVDAEMGSEYSNMTTDAAGIMRHQLPQSLVPIQGNPVLQRLLHTQEPVIIDDLSHHPEMNVPDLPLRSPARSLLVVPLLYDGKIIGSISLRQSRQPRQWTNAEVELTQAVAVQAAIAVHQSRLYQKTRQQAEQLMELDRQKNEFFQNVSHEFRTPLTLTIGPLESAVAQHQGLTYEQSCMALRNSRRLLRLVNQLLDLQRLDAGRMQPRFRPCDLKQFVFQIVETFRHYCERKQIHIEAQLSDCPAVYLDMEKFDKVLYNLLSNAMKFTEPGGSILVTLDAAGDHCVLQVRDTGIGIRPDQIPYLFERFRQADGSTNRRYEGSGLGLALVKKLVEMHGGKVSVDSTYRQGTTFTIWLQTGITHLPPDQVIQIPAEMESSRATVELADLEAVTSTTETTDVSDFPEPEAAPVPLGTPIPASPVPSGEASTVTKILVVDDNLDLRAYVTDILQRSGYSVLIARNGVEGFQMAQTHHPNLVLTDLMMPLVSGLEMIQMIRREPSLVGLPIILLTAKADEDTRIEGAEKGADAYLAKPFNERELLADVRNLLALKATERRVAELNQYLTESVLKRFLPPSLVQKAACGELSLDLRPEPKLITVLFSDIVGFTQLSNTLRSRRVSELLNEYLAEMTRAIFEHGGTVDKFMGDAILAIFGAPEELPPNEQVKRAIAAARQMYRSLETLNERWQAQGIGQVQFRCGIHQGTAVVGMFGGAERSDYTAIGPSVNIAARIQEAADANTILVSAAVADYLELEEDEVTKFSPLQLKGVDETVLTFAIKPHFDRS
jgi:GAF domain-containing protein/response regulator RpfG family c-di-GMP phosphodiesterase